MLRGFYTAASGMISQQRQQEALANNVANVNTPGYKADQATLRSFPELLIQQMGTENLRTSKGFKRPYGQPIGALNTGVYVQEMVPNFDQGDVKQTGTYTDIALINGDVPDENGHLFFTVRNEDGEVRYTKNGDFQIDGEGFLTTHLGLYLLDEANNPIQTNHLEFTVDSNGLIQIGDQVTQLGLAYSEDTNTLSKEGTDLFSGETVGVPAEATYTIQQGFLEQSNVDSLRSMTEMMEAYRMFETNQRVLRAYDESMGKAVSEIGRL